ncbi:alpha/beta-hydrolase [Lojkania enalia]|uniref:Kynurenine formamidase n=1 Tax=Lojkania enalia TaxID=147567 RepID=A0A9P4MUF5_9PLEO|nr:alpha/beta-hydrolase [Didymosphaeria enalia]
MSHEGCMLCQRCGFSSELQSFNAYVYRPQPCSSFNPTIVNPQAYITAPIELNMTINRLLPIHRPDIPYTSPARRYQTLDIWLPRPFSESSPQKHVWIIYIHGGAWRDPAQTSACISPTLRHLPPTLIRSRIAGIASINYRLSSYPSHPSDPSAPDDGDRNVRHPTHIRDVAAALDFLRREYGLAGQRRSGNIWQASGTRDGNAGFEWIGAGHSCGATLLCQLVSGIGLPLSEHTITFARPKALVLLEGIFNIPMLLRNHAPEKCGDYIARIYRDIVVGAFGEEGWVDASPVSGSYTGIEWPEGNLVLLCHSPDDRLVEGEQASGMLTQFEACGWESDGSGDVKGARLVQMRRLEGGHDWIWEDGRQIAKVIEEVVERISMK